MSNEMTTEDIFEQYKSMIEGVLREGKSILTDEMIEADQRLFNEAQQNPILYRIRYSPIDSKCENRHKALAVAYKNIGEIEFNRCKRRFNIKGHPGVSLGSFSKLQVLGKEAWS